MEVNLIESQNGTESTSNSIDMNANNDDMVLSLIKNNDFVGTHTNSTESMTIDSIANAYGKVLSKKLDLVKTEASLKSASNILNISINDKCQQSRVEKTEKVEVKPLIRVVSLEKLLSKPTTSNEANNVEENDSSVILITSDSDDEVVLILNKKTKKGEKQNCKMVPNPISLYNQKIRDQENNLKLKNDTAKGCLLNNRNKLNADSCEENVVKETVGKNQNLKSENQRKQKPLSPLLKNKSGKQNILCNIFNNIGDDRFKKKCVVRIKKNKFMTGQLNKWKINKNKSKVENHSVHTANIFNSEVSNSDQEGSKQTHKTNMRRSRSSSSSSAGSAVSSMRGSSLDKEEESSQSFEKAEYSDEINSSESEVIQTRKKRIYKKSSNDGSSSDSENPKKLNKKRVVVKPTNESSDDDGEGSPLKRKKIRKLIKTRDLDRDTKLAAREEEERRKRIEERQKKYNEIYEKPENVQLDELVLDFDEANKTALLSVDSKLIKLLKPHQASGVKFMWDACFETLAACVEKPGSGCILAHCMGLGKTLQVITLTHTLLVNSNKTKIERALIISPLSTITNWAREYHQWMKHCKNKNIEIYDMSKYKDKNTRIFKIDEWFQEGGVCIMGYDMFRILSNEKTKGLKKKQREALQKSLIDPGPDIVVCDEGHLLKNEKTSLSKAVTRMRTKRRIVLTGTPLQNNLKEYYCMIQFIKPNLLGTYKEYLNRFVNPITNGQYTDSTDRDIRLMKHRSHILHKLLQACIQRRDYSVLAPYLPPKHEYVVYLQLTDLQKNVYQYYMTKQRELFVEASNSKGAKLFQDFQNLRRIWTHPKCLRVNSDIVIKKKLLNYDSEGSLKDFIIEEDESSESSNEEESDCSDDSNNVKKSIIRTRNSKISDDEVEEIIPPKPDVSEWWMQFVPEDELNKIECSSKILLLMSLLEHCEALGDKLLVFSQSLQSLDVIEHFLSLIDAKTRGNPIDGDVKDFKGYWVPEVDYFRLDGSKNVDNREIMCRQFNNTNNLRARLFLISTRAGGLGINLVAANRVVIFDVSWNPSHDTQSIFRVYRFGQNKPCYIYRLIAMGTMEQKVYERQVAKQATAKRVIDEQQISRHYNQSDLQELYSYELTPQTQREIPKLPKDRLFAELLSNYDKIIFKYHEHDSLLENEISENLTEEERKAAWAEYEDEKVRPAQTQQQYVAYNRQAYGNYGNATGSVTSNKIFGFRTDVLVQLLNMKVKQDNPQLNPPQVVQMVPLYLQQLYTQMNMGDPTLYKDLLELHKTLEMPRGMYMNPLLYANQNAPTSSTVNPMYSPMPRNIQPTSSNSTEPIEVYEID